MRLGRGHSPGGNPGSEPGWLVGSGLAFGAVLATLLAFEIVVRLVGWGQVVEFVPHPGWGYLMRPSQTVWTFGLPVSINALGLRGPEVSSPKGSHDLRVLFVGDSVTYGGGRIADEALFCRLVESAARRKGLAVEAVNLSAPGWSPQNWRGYLEGNGLLEADAVVVVLPEIDVTRPFSRMEFHGFRERAPWLRAWGFALRLQLALWPPARPPRDRAATISANVDALTYVKNQAGSRPFLVVFLPSPEGGAGREGWAPFEAAFPDALDLRSEAKSRPLFQDALHLNREGHRFVAERMWQRLEGPLSGR